MHHPWVKIRIPATTSNLGSGFDSFGIALRLYNYVKIRPTDRPGRIQSQSQPGEPSANTRAMVEAAAALFFARSKRRPFPFDVQLGGHIPVARGLGSSLTLRLGVVAGLNELAGAKLNRQQLLEITAELEHHPDNAAPAVFGGFAVTGQVGRSLRCLHFPVAPRLRFVTLVPPFEVSTERARHMLPLSYSRADTIHSLNRAALIAAAFARGDYKALPGLFDDRIHQPYRAQLIPQLTRIIRAGEQAGALGGWLSGSGSTVICLANQKPEAVAKAMGRALPGSEVKLLAADNVGLRLMSCHG